jgi:hypothetical protein
MSDADGATPTTPPASVGLRGFTDVGFDVCFNADGRPNKSPTALDFCTGSAAIYWTLEDCLKFVFNWYIPATVATLNTAQLKTSNVTRAAWLRRPAHLNLSGETALDAVDQVVGLTGESWTLDYSANISAFRSVHAAGGTVRAAEAFLPSRGAQAASASDKTPSEMRVSGTLENCRDSVQVVSGILISPNYIMKGNHEQHNYP